MTTTAKSTTAKAPRSNGAAKKEVQLTEDDLKIINSEESLNKRVAQLPHLWGFQAVLATAFGKSRQRIINAIKLAKKQK